MTEFTDKQLQVDASPDLQYPYIVIGRDEDGTYGVVKNAQGLSAWAAVRYARTFEDMRGYRRFRVIGTAAGTIMDMTIERRYGGGDRRGR